MISPYLFDPRDARGRPWYRGQGPRVRRVVAGFRFPFNYQFLLCPWRVGDRCHYYPGRNVDGRVCSSVQYGPKALRDERRHFVVGFELGGVSTSGRR